MEDKKIKNLQPKDKLRELKAIQKGEQQFKSTLGRMKEYQDEEVTDRETRKM